jgi:hypothetical protein
MKIAFDVSGTIEGPKRGYVLILLKLLQDAGHEIIVWSNSYGYTTDAVKKYDLKNVECMSKKTTWDCDNDESQFIDIAIDDDSSQTWLASKRFIWVSDLPETVEGIKKLATEIGSAT